MSTIPGPAQSRFLGILFDDTLPSDVRYAFELLESKDPKLFFNGLKILASIFESNDTERKKEWASKVLSMLCKVMPSYVKMKDDIFELNKTKIDDAIKLGKHPLDLKRTLETARKSAQANLASSDKPEYMNEQPTGIVMTAPPDVQDDDIKIISIEDQAEREERFSADVIEDIIAPGEENVDEVPELEPVIEKARVLTDSLSMEFVSNSQSNVVEEKEKSLMQEKNETLTFGEPGIGEETEDEWVSASDFKSWIDEKVIYDTDGNVSKQLEKGLNLINPVEHEAEIDMNYSSGKGYHDPYRPREAYPSPENFSLTPESDYVTNEISPLETAAVEIKSGLEIGNQECGFGDGSIDPSETTVYVCPNCQTAFHEGCGKMVLEFQGAICPVCNHPW
ncbi:MAG TPA: hypothetical protein VKM55_21570 [Candidatus Lokiarchaeia archaeon]|nr:hypothetical protein [Candidatus Lokiarchaeia archaeon]